MGHVCFPATINESPRKVKKPPRQVKSQRTSTRNRFDSACDSCYHQCCFSINPRPSTCLLIYDSLHHQTMPHEFHPLRSRLLQYAYLFIPPLCSDICIPLSEHPHQRSRTDKNRPSNWQSPPRRLEHCPLRTEMRKGNDVCPYS
jgi:hypothetical protein